MKRIFKISIIVLVYLVLCGKSCVSDQDIKLQQQKEATAMMDNIRDEFGMENLNEDSQFAMEIAAVQKLNDFADYLMIYSNSSLDSAFRIRAAGLITDLFVSRQSAISFGFRDIEKEGRWTLATLLDDSWGDEVDSVYVRYDSIRFMNHLNQSDALSYKALMNCSQSVVAYSSTNTYIISDEQIEVNILVSRREKSFGSDTLTIWVVQLGDMDLIKEPLP